MQAVKTKTYVLIISELFPVSHPSAGQPTDFEKNILNGTKLHTIRKNYHLWKERIDEVNRGEAVISLRKWTGMPYRSPQQKILDFTKRQIRITRVQKNDRKSWIYLPHSPVSSAEIAANDGLSTYDFEKYFENTPNGTVLACLSFPKLIP